MTLSRLVAKLLARQPNTGLAIHPSQLTGPRLAAMRRLAKWSQVDLAQRAGVHVQTVKYWEGNPA